MAGMMATLGLRQSAQNKIASKKSVPQLYVRRVCKRAQSAPSSVVVRIALWPTRIPKTRQRLKTQTPSAASCVIETARGRSQK